jgi:hypothetical protein
LEVLIDALICIAYLQHNVGTVCKEVKVMTESMFLTVIGFGIGFTCTGTLFRGDILDKVVAVVTLIAWVSFLAWR